jgi:hypothetical protein
MQEHDKKMKRINRSTAARTTHRPHSDQLLEQLLFEE